MPVHVKCEKGSENHESSESGSEMCDEGEYSSKKGQGEARLVQRTHQAIDMALTKEDVHSSDVEFSSGVSQLYEDSPDSQLPRRVRARRLVEDGNVKAGRRDRRNHLKDNSFVPWNPQANEIDCMTENVSQINDGARKDSNLAGEETLLSHKIELSEIEKRSKVKGSQHVNGAEQTLTEGGEEVGYSECKSQVAQQDPETCEASADQGSQESLHKEGYPSYGAHNDSQEQLRVNNDAVESSARLEELSRAELAEAISNGNALEYNQALNHDRDVHDGPEECNMEGRSDEIDRGLSELENSGVRQQGQKQESDVVSEGADAATEASNGKVSSNTAKKPIEDQSPRDQVDNKADRINHKTDGKALGETNGKIAKVVKNTLRTNCSPGEKGGTILDETPSDLTNALNQEF
eukprot:761552-Hanusia_phi.AAC.1